MTSNISRANSRMGEIRKNFCNFRFQNRDAQFQIGNNLLQKHRSTPKLFLQTPLQYHVANLIATK